MEFQHFVVIYRRSFANLCPSNLNNFPGSANSYELSIDEVILMATALEGSTLNFILLILTEQLTHCLPD